MNDLPEKLPDGRTVEKVPVEIPITIKQILARIAAAEIRLKNVSTTQEGMLAAQQLSLVVRRSATEITRYSESREEHKLDLQNMAEEFEILSATANQLYVTIKTHPRELLEHKAAINSSFEAVMKQSQNAGAAVREYLLAVADAQKAKQDPPSP